MPKTGDSTSTLSSNLWKMIPRETTKHIINVYDEMLAQSVVFGDEKVLIHFESAVLSTYTW